MEYGEKIKMSILPITATLLKVIKDVTGKEPTHFFNEKKKKIERRYKFAGIHDVTGEQLTAIVHEIGKRHPDKRFAVGNHSYGSRGGRYGYHSGLVVKVG